MRHVGPLRGESPEAPQHRTEAAALRASAALGGVSACGEGHGQDSQEGHEGQGGHEALQEAWRWHQFWMGKMGQVRLKNWTFH